MAESKSNLVRLARMIQGFIDADILLAEDGGALLDALDGACRHPEMEGRAAGRPDMARFVRELEALVGSGGLDRAHGRALIESARRIPDGPAGRPARP